MQYNVVCAYYDNTFETTFAFIIIYSPYIRNTHITICGAHTKKEKKRKEKHEKQHEKLKKEKHRQYNHAK